MIEKDVFKGKNINLFCPNVNEFLYNFIYLIEYSDEASNDWKSRHVVLSVIEILLNFEVIYVYDWIAKPKLKNKKLDNKSIIKEIDEIWFKGAKYSDYYNMVMFGSTRWYVDSLAKLGMTNTTNWEYFVKNKIGDLEKWIEDNKPSK